MDVLLDFVRCSYLEGLARQDEVRAALPDGTLHGLAFEHPPTFTFGRHASAEHLLVPGTFLAERGVAVVESERGGEVTFHGPGQLVLYPLLRLGALHLKRWVWLLEEALILTLARYGIVGARGEAPGIFVHDGSPSPRVRAASKIGFIGLRIRAGVSTHGISLNVNNDLEPFTWMNPCGAVQLAVTSLAREMPNPSAPSPALPEVARVYMDTLAALLIGDRT